MNAVTKSLTDALRHRSARLSQRLDIWVGTLDLGMEVLDYKIRAGFCRDYTVDVTVTSPNLDIDGKLCVGRRAGLHIDEHVQCLQSTISNRCNSLSLPTTASSRVANVFV